jgi:DNA repair photolyase
MRNVAAVVTLSPSKARITEVQCKSMLNKSAITDWTVNCYAGCEHGCVYCYARFATRFSHPGKCWGSFVDVKVNAPQLLEREVKRKRVGRVFISSVCDGWQPVEERYGLTRSCIRLLLQCGYPLSVLTKSGLAGRDLDLLAGRDGVEFGVTITTLDEEVSRCFEPCSSSPSVRLALLEEAKRRGLKTFVFLGPLLPGLSDAEESLGAALQAVKEVGADYFYVDLLNPRYGVWPSLRTLLQDRFPHLTEHYRRILFDKRERAAYSLRLRTTVNQQAMKHGLAGRMTLCF